MTLDLWFREDVARILAATHEAMTSTQAATSVREVAYTEAYRRGYEDALRTVGVAFGVMLPRGVAARSEGWRALDGDFRRLP